MNIEIANRLINLRKKNGYSQEDLADKLGISRQAISKWERAESSPDTDNLIALSRLYQVSLDELLQTDEIKITDNASNSSEIKNNNVLNDKDKVNSRAYGMYLFPYPVITVIAFFLIGFLLKKWEYAFLVYFTVPIYYGIAEIVHRNKVR